jgi:DNA uptake protein ComE-like DNA-binding protein
MAQSHWLDPLARQVLRVMKQPSPKPDPALAWQIDVNRASLSDWLKLPGLQTNQAELLLKLQRGGVQLSGPADLGQILELSEVQLELWKPHLLFRWYSEPPSPVQAPINLNSALAAELSSLEVFSPDGRKRLLRERARRPFSDLADLQERLGLPAGVVEDLIGKVSFGLRSGPALPSTGP